MVAIAQAENLQARTVVEDGCKLIIGYVAVSEAEASQATHRSDSECFSSGVIISRGGLAWPIHVHSVKTEASQLGACYASSLQDFTAKNVRTEL